MSTLLFFRAVGHATKRTEKIEVRLDGHVFIAGIDGDDNSYIQEWDIRNVLADRQYVDYTDDDFDGEPVLEAERTEGGIYRFVINVYYDESGTVPAMDTESLIETFPAYPVWLSTDAEGSLDTATDTKSVELTYVHKQQEAIDAIENVWRSQKRAWMREALEYSDVNPDLLKHAGLYLNAADQAIQNLFQDSSVDPLDVAEIARQAALGALDIDSVEKFAERLNEFIAFQPDGPAQASLWVRINEETDDIERLDLSDSHNYGPFDSDYNSISHDWIVENQPGVVDIDNESPEAGDTMTATLTDYDGVKDGTTSWQWQKESATPDTYEDITGGTSAAYTVPTGTASGTRYKAAVTYEDSYGPNQSAESKTIKVSI